MFAFFSEQRLFKVSHWQISLTSPLGHRLETKYLWLSELLDFSFIYWLISQKTHLTRFFAKEVENIFPSLLQANICCFPKASVVEILPKKVHSSPLSQQDNRSFVRIYKFFLKDDVSLSILWFMSDTRHLVSLVWEYFYYIFQFLLLISILLSPPNLRFFSSFINTLNI